MRICKAIERVYSNKEEDDASTVKKHIAKETTMYTCSGCKYESNRQFNVLRHEKRIHKNQKLHFCCGKRMYTKGDYYLHCEQVHPEKRSHCITSRTKYKITNDSVPMVRHDHRSTRQRYNWKLSQSFSKSTRMKKQSRVKSKVSVKCSLICNDFDMEDVPLISFLTDHRSNSLRTLSSPKFPIETDDKSEGEASQTVNIAISSERNTVSEDDVENVQKVSNSSTLVELPTKKLILHRFRMNVEHEFQIPLIEQNNNVYSQVNFEETRSIETLQQSRSKNLKRCLKGNKENVSKFAFSLEQQVNIKLDNAITVPVATQLHRDFLASIDFDQYKIF